MEGGSYGLELGANESGLNWTFDLLGGGPIPGGGPPIPGGGPFIPDGGPIEGGKPDGGPG